ncbi:signal transduction histidine kinase [Nocardioides cavernae]|uniref:Signal transduction histidine kinase n=1 Tax=Nocardioides cavernae TaxID=1921566 RepID=A0A7Y9KRE0_9ACTN|nr:sensor histidine kinase [Nocardioides cavernae]NYE35202.1 signal transduction histidine kinase [Nocardioides cavernae]
MDDDLRWLHRMPFVLLALATAVATTAAPSLGAAAVDVRITLVGSLVTAIWMVATPRPSALHWVGRTALAFVLCWLNPLYAIFAFFGFIDAYDSLRGRWMYVGLLAVGITQAGSQSGGLPPRDAVQLWVFLALVGVNAGLASAFMSISLKTERRTEDLERLNAELETALAENQALHARLVEQARATGVQEERARLAREIHDTTAQSLAGIVTQLEAAVGGERHERALALARHALAEARRSMLDLSPSDLDGANLPDAVRGVVTAWSTEHGVRAEAVVVGDPVPLHPEVEATVLRIAQESLTNVAKHAAAGRVGVTLSYDGDEVVLDVRDDGAGFDVDAPTGPSSFGLRGMRQRVARLAGDLTLESRAGRGTAVSARLPALAREAA